MARPEGCGRERPGADPVVKAASFWQALPLFADGGHGIPVRVGSVHPGAPLLLTSTAPASRDTGEEAFERPHDFRGTDSPCCHLASQHSLTSESLADREDQQTSASVGYPDSGRQWRVRRVWPCQKPDMPKVGNSTLPIR